MNFFLLKNTIKAGGSTATKMLSGWYPLIDCYDYQSTCGAKKSKFRTLNFENGETKKMVSSVSWCKEMPLAQCSIYGFTECSRTTVNMKMNNMDIGSVELFLSKAGSIWSEWRGVWEVYWYWQGGDPAWHTPHLPYDPLPPSPTGLSLSSDS